MSAERVASDAELQAFDEQLSASTIPAQIGDIKTEDLVGSDALLTPGKTVHKIFYVVSHYAIGISCSTKSRCI